MNTPTPYHKLSPEEQVQIINRMAELRASCAELTPLPRFLNRDQQKIIREVATFLLHFPSCISNVQPIIHASSIVHRQAARVIYIINYISNKIASEHTVATPSGERVILIDQQQSLRRGRPTASESEQRQRERQQKAQAEAIANLTGHSIAQPAAAPVDNSRPTDTSRRKQEPDLFSQAVTDAIESATVPDASPSGSSDGGDQLPPPLGGGSEVGASSTLHSLREWIWILPDNLAAGVKTLRDLRTQHASHSEQAKLLMEQGATTDAIAEHTQAAAAINDQIAHLYTDIDQHLATMYCLLTEVNPDYKNIADRYAERGGIKALIDDLKPYYTKLANLHSQLLERANKLNAAATRDPERDKRVHTIKAYFGRKDVSATTARLDKLRAYRQEAETLNVDSDALAAMDLIIADCEQQIASQS